METFLQVVFEGLVTLATKLFGVRRSRTGEIWLGAFLVVVAVLVTIVVARFVWG